MGLHEPVTVEIDRVALGIVIESLRYLRDHFDVPGAIDRAQLMATRDDVAGIVALLESGPRQNNPIVLSMSRHEWSIYTHAIGYTCAILPRGRADDADLLEELFGRYSDWESEGFPTAG